MNTGLLWANLLGALLALVANLWGACAGPPEHRTLRGTVATLASIYAALYVLAIAGAISGDARTAIAQGLGPVVWVTVWAAPPIHAARVHRRTLRAIGAMLDAVPDRIGASRA